MDPLYEKIYKICLTHPDFSVYGDERVKKELDYFVDNDLLLSMWSLYQVVIENPDENRGNVNTCNSIVSYLLSNTTAKPRNNFKLDPRRTYARDGFPDIDMDFDHSRRHEILTYIINKYGADCVANIGVVQRLQPKNAVRKTIKVLDPCDSIKFDAYGNIVEKNDSLNYALQNEITQGLPTLMKRADGTLVKTVSEAYNEYSEFRRYMDEYPEVYRIAQKVEGCISALGVHPAGIVISPIPLYKIAPLHATRGEEGNDKVIATQYPMADVESLGLIKYDVLGISTKTAISLAKKSIKENYSIELDLSNLPLNDKKTLDLLSSGKTDACFQLENTGMKQALQQIGISNFANLVATVAMYRPGPKDYIPEYAARKKGVHKVVYDHPIAEQITKSTFGILCYQEQIWQLFMSMASMTASDGYTFMKGCAKKDVNKIQKYEEKFIKNSLSNGVSESVAIKIFENMKLFSNYAFNKAHACSYAYESYKTAYLKAHYPMEFMAARLTVVATERHFEYVQKYEADCTRLGMKIVPPDINRSKLTYTIIDNKTLLRPLIIEDVGEKAAEDIIKHQPYTGADLVYAFASKVGSSVNTKAVEALHAAGLFGNVKKASLVRAFEQIKKDRKLSKGVQVDDLFG